METSNHSRSAALRSRLRRVGIAGFAFFTLKGLLWLLVPWLLMRLG